jgi:hypothetical protein
MAIILAVDSNSLPDYYIKEQLDQIGEYWADLIITGIKDGKKPEILIDRSGSMSMDLGSGITRMDLAIGVIESLAQNLRKKAPEKYIELYDSIPVKSWGSEVHEEHFVSPKQRGDYTGEQSPPTRKKTTLTDFLQNPIVPSPLPQIPCTDGTTHSLWLNESDFPLVITDDYGYKIHNELIENYRNFDCCDGNNIVAIDSFSQEYRLRKMNKKIRNAAMGYDAINTRDFR